jgi:hypothetical protein
MNKTYTIIDPGSGYQIHRAGCAHLSRGRQRHAEILETISAPSLDAALGQYFDSEMLDMGWSPDDCHVFPCAEQ